MVTATEHPLSEWKFTSYHLFSSRWWSKTLFQRNKILKFLRRLLFSHLLLLFTSFTSAASHSLKCSNLSNKETTKPLVSFLLFCCCDKLWNNLCPHMFSHNLPSAWSWTPPRNRPEPPSSSSPTQLLDGLKIGWFKSHNSPIVHQSYMQFKIIHALI